MVERGMQDVYDGAERGVAAVDEVLVAGDGVGVAAARRGGGGSGADSCQKVCYRTRIPGPRGVVTVSVPLLKCLCSTRRTRPTRGRGICVKVGACSGRDRQRAGPANSVDNGAVRGTRHIAARLLQTGHESRTLLKFRVNDVSLMCARPMVEGMIRG